MEYFKGKHFLKNLPLKSRAEDKSYEGYEGKEETSEIPLGLRMKNVFKVFESKFSLISSFMVNYTLKDTWYLLG